MSAQISDLNDMITPGIYRAPDKLPELLIPPPGVRYYKATGHHRIKGEWLVVRTGERGLTTWDYLCPMTVGRINYPKEGR